MRYLLCPVAAAVLLAGCTRTLPPKRPQANLYRDLQRLVGLSVTTGWHIDRVEVDGLLPDALLSACQVEPAARQELLAWLDQQIAARGGPVEDAYVKRGRKLSKVKALLELTRIRMALAATIEHADECPFWLEPRKDFHGRQISDDRWMLSFGGGGKGQVVNQGGRYDLRAGGAGRLLLGRSFGDRLTLLFGVEAGASAAFPRDDMGGRGDLVLGVDLVTPLVMRYRFVNSYLEFEGGFFGQITEEQTDMVPGMHIGASIGGRASRKRWFFPGAAFGVSYERTFPSDMQGDPVNLFKLGFRVALDIDL